MPNSYSMTLTALEKQYEKDKDVMSFLQYFDTNYSKYFKNGMLNYSNIDQQHRSNLCLESITIKKSYQKIQLGMI